MRRFLTVVLVVCASVFTLAAPAHAADKPQSVSAQKAAKASARKAAADKVKAAEKKKVRTEKRAEKMQQSERRLPALSKSAPVADKPVSVAEKKPRSAGVMPVGQLKGEVDAQLALAQQRTSGLIATKHLTGTKAKATKQPVDAAASQVRAVYKRAAADGVITKQEAKDVQLAMRALRVATPRLTPKK